MRLALAHRIACGALGLLVAGCLAAMPAWGKSPATVHQARARPRCGSRPATDRWLHVVWIVMENHGYGNVIGSREAPYLNALARQCGLATDYHAISHPSLPNYIALTSGSTQGITEDGGSGGNRVPLIALARSVPRGARSGGFFTHYSLLRTTEDMLRLSSLAAAAGAPSMRGAFGL